MNDIKNKDDIAIFVNLFYTKVRRDDLIGPIFNRIIAAEDWPAHLEKLTNFWNTVLFGEIDYRGNPFSKHVNLPIDAQHFNRWIELLTATIKENYEGVCANDVLAKANKMSLMFQAKLNHIRKNPNQQSIV